MQYSNFPDDFQVQILAGKGTLYSETQKQLFPHSQQVASIQRARRDSRWCSR